MHFVMGKCLFHKAGATHYLAQLGLQDKGRGINDCLCDRCYKDGGDIGLFITPVPKVLNDVLFFVLLTTFGTFYRIITGLFINLLRTFQPLIIIYRRQKG